MASNRTLERAIREDVCDYLGHHDNEIVKIALKYFSNEYSVTRIEKRLAKILEQEDAFSLAISLDLVYRKYLASELQFLSDRHEKEKNRLNGLLIEQQNENQLLTGQISLVTDQLVQASDVNKSLTEQISVVNDHFVTERQANLLLKEKLGSVNDNLDQKTKAKEALEEEMERFSVDLHQLKEEHHQELQNALSHLSHYKERIRNNNTVLEEYGEYGYRTIAMQNEIADLRAHLQVEQEGGHRTFQENMVLKKQLQKEKEMVQKLTEKNLDLEVKVQNLYQEIHLLTQELNEARELREVEKIQLQETIVDMSCRLKTLKAEQCQILGNQSVASSFPRNNQLMMHENLFTCFDESGSYLSNVTHQSVKCLNSTGKAAMLVKIQNISFESYVLATRDPELDNLFKLSGTPCGTLFKTTGCAVVSKNRDQLLSICSSQDCQKEQPEVKHYSEPKSAAHNIPVRTVVFWNSKFKKSPTQMAQHKRVAETYSSPTSQNRGSNKANQSTKQNKTRSKRPCFIKGCNIETTHLKKHIIGRHLPRFVSIKSDLTLEEQMKHYESLLMSVAHDFGCLSLQGLLRLVIKRKWYPFGGSFAISKDDLKLITDFQYWVSGQEDSDTLSISPPSNVSCLLHWRILSCLLDRVTQAKMKGRPNRNLGKEQGYRSCISRSKEESNLQSMSIQNVKRFNTATTRKQSSWTFDSDKNQWS